MLWETLREEEFEGAIERSGGLCVLPIGCLEKHGQHLPVGTDSYHNWTVCALAAELEEVVVFPNAMWLGDMMGLHGNDGKKFDRGGIALNPHTLLTVLTELCDEIHRNGFRKILLVSGHGGNMPLLNYFLRAQRYEKKEYATLVTGMCGAPETGAPGLYRAVMEDRSKFPLITDEDVAVLKNLAERAAQTKEEGHAGFYETALMMGIVPQYCRIDKVEQESGLSTHQADYLSGWGVNSGTAWGYNYPNAFHGYAPVGVTETIGKTVLKVHVDCMCRLYKQIKEDEKCVRMAQRLPIED